MRDFLTSFYQIFVSLGIFDVNFDRANKNLYNTAHNEFISNTEREQNQQTLHMICICKSNLNSNIDMRLNVMSLHLLVHKYQVLTGVIQIQ